MSQIKTYSLPFKGILGIDFDHTICNSSFPELGPEMDDAGDTIRKLVEEGYGVVINTCRSNEALGMAIGYLRRRNIPYHYINCNFPHLIELYNSDTRKVSADVYIDDKNLGGFPGWKKAYKIINKKFS